MTGRIARSGATTFARVLETLREVRLRPEIDLEEIPAPQRLAPHAVALSADVARVGGHEALASGRFVLLHDPSGPEAWQSTWRVVTFARAEMETELASDALLGEVGWSWLAEALQTSSAGYRRLGGTVTRVVSESFGALADRDSTVEMEVRASWSPTDDDEVAAHLLVWSELLEAVAGLPPLPEGVTAMPGRRR